MQTKHQKISIGLCIATVVMLAIVFIGFYTISDSLFVTGVFVSFGMLLVAVFLNKRSVWAWLSFVVSTILTAILVWFLLFFEFKI